MRNCPLCASEAGGCSFPYFNKWNGKIFNYYKCVSCKSTFVDPVPDAADFAQMYSKSVYDDAHYNNFNLTAAQQSIARVLPYLIRGNPSVLRWFAVSFASIKKTLGRNVGSTTPPTHLFMTNAKAQRAFFSDSLGYRCVDCFIYETGWPYLNSNSESKWVVSNVIKGGIGRLAVVASHALPVLGNRFVGIFQP